MKKIFSFAIINFLLITNSLAHELELDIDVINKPPSQHVYIYADAEDHLQFF